MIGDNDPVTHLPRFDAYKSLHIERRDKRDLKPEDAFLYLLKKGVFRAGLAQRFNPGIELMLVQDLIQPVVKRIAGVSTMALVAIQKSLCRSRPSAFPSPCEKTLEHFQGHMF